MYLSAVEEAFHGEVDFAQLIKLYGAAPKSETRYSPVECIGCERIGVTGSRTRPMSRSPTGGRTSPSA